MAEQTRLTDAELEALHEKITPGPWSWWTSCSFRRLSAKGDGDVLCATTQSDGHPDVHLKNGGWKGPDGCLIEISPNLLAEVIERRAKDAAVAELVASDMEYDEALAAYNACAPIRSWHSPAVKQELSSYRRKARNRLNAAKLRRADALAAVRGGAQ